ncbi:phage head-tail adapter protein [Alkalihalophilus marmarensis]|uniref:phage head-tail adapter protein n=1 Tax=Alkalihalophilus marmarensis TaxID=521377 RepID=UPI002E22E116|nr:phage head-tail adapter protein [Alkalihalophilus marmarensis]
MRKYEYKPPRVHSGELRTPVYFYEEELKQSPMPGSNIYKKVFTSWAKVDNVWMKDLEVAKVNGTLSDVTITIRDPQHEFIPTNLHHLEVDAPEYKGIKFNIKQVQPDLQNKEFINVIAGVSK